MFKLTIKICILLLFVTMPVFATKHAVEVDDQNLLSTVYLPSLDNKKYNYMPENLPRPLPIYVTIMINKMNKIDERNEIFDGTIDLHLRWQDSSLAFDPLKMGSNRLEFDGDDAIQQLKKMWDPAVIISNIVKQSAGIEPTLWIYQDGTVVYSQRIAATFTNSYDLNSFPFDTQQLVVTLTSAKYDINEVNFNQVQSDINHSRIFENVNLPGWNLNHLVFQNSSVREINGLFYPQFQTKIIAERVAAGHLLMLLPLFLLMLMPMILTLYIHADLMARLSAWAGALLATVALSFTLDSNYPELCGNCIIAIMLQYCFLFQFIMICLTCTVFNPQVIDKMNNSLLVTEIHSFLKWSIPIVFILLIIIRILLVFSN